MFINPGASGPFVMPLSLTAHNVYYVKLSILFSVPIN